MDCKGKSTQSNSKRLKREEKTTRRSQEETYNRCCINRSIDRQESKGTTLCVVVVIGSLTKIPLVSRTLHGSVKKWLNLARVRRVNIRVNHWKLATLFAKSTGLCESRVHRFHQANNPVSPIYVPSTRSQSISRHSTDKLSALLIENRLYGTDWLSERYLSLFSTKHYV